MTAVADLNYSRAGRMEAKGCAKPCVWKDARRYFYWALRARQARSRLLRQLADANPESAPGYRAQALTQLAPLDADMRQSAEVLENLDITTVVAQFRTDRVLQSLQSAAQVDRKATFDGMLQAVGELSAEEKAALLAVLQNAS